MIKKVTTIFIFLLLLFFLWSGIALFKIIQNHKTLVGALKRRGGYYSNLIDPKPYLRNASIMFSKTYKNYIFNPFSNDNKLVYTKKGYIVCYAHFDTKFGKWYFLIPVNVQKAKIPKPKIPPFLDFSKKKNTEKNTNSKTNIKVTPTPSKTKSLSKNQ